MQLGSAHSFGECRLQKPACPFAGLVLQPPANTHLCFTPRIDQVWFTHNFWYLIPCSLQSRLIIVTFLASFEQSGNVHFTAIFGRGWRKAGEGEERGV